MKLWEMISIFRDDLGSLECVLREDDRWASYLDAFIRFGELVRSQDRQVLDTVLPEPLSIRAMKQCKLKFCIQDGRLRGSPLDKPPSDQLSASDVYARFGAAAIENALEYGSAPIFKERNSSSENHMEQVFKEGASAHDTDDFAKATAKLMPLADDGHAGAQYLVGDMYRWGNGVDQNAEKSLHFLKAAADQGHPKAAFDLFLLLNPGGLSAPEAMQSLPKNAEASKRYLDVAVIRFRELAEAGDVDSMAYLGLLFHHGWGVELDGAEAIRWYTKAFDAGGCGAANNLSLVYYEGDIRVRDKAKALFWYMKAKEHDCQCVGIQEFESLTSSPDANG